MRLFRVYLRSETRRVRATGRPLERDRPPRNLPAAVVRTAIEEAEAATSRRAYAVHLRLAVNYSARDAILAAAACRRVRADLEPYPSRHSGACWARWIAIARPVRDVDLLIRTGGEQRLGDFLLWECAYAELVFSAADVARLHGRETWLPRCGEFQRRERRFGTVPTAGSGYEDVLPLVAAGR